VLLLVFLVIAVPYKFWLAHIYNFLVINKDFPKPDAILVEGWVSDRQIQYVVSLYQRWPDMLIVMVGPKILQLSDFYPAQTWAEARKIQLIGRGIPEEDVIPVVQERSGTRNEALASLNVISQHNVKVLLIITAPHHLRRSYQTYRRIYKSKDIEVFCSAYPVGSFQANNWWKSHDGVSAVWNEYMKLLYYFVKGYL